MSRLVGMVTVYGYRCWDDEAGEHVLMRPKATVDALVRMSGCTPVEGSGEEVPGWAVTADGLFYGPGVVLPAAESRSIGNGGAQVEVPSRST
jgi:hypothetical protein